MNSETSVLPRINTETYSGKPIKKMEKSSSTFLKLLLYTLFDNSPASALKFLETTEDALNVYPVQSFPRVKSDSKRGEYDEGQGGTKFFHSFRKPPILNRDKFLKVFKRRPSKVKIDPPVTNDLPALDVYSNADVCYNGNISSSSMFEIDLDKEENSNLDPQVRVVVCRLESEISALKVQLESKEEEFKKLKDEVLSLRTSSVCSESASPSSDVGPSSHASLGSDKFQGFVGIKAPSETSVQNCDSHTHTYMYFGSANEQVLEQVQDKESRLLCSTRPESEQDACSSKKENLGKYCSEMLQKHMDTFLNDAAAALGKGETLHHYTHIECGSQPNETQGQANHFVEKDLSLEPVSNLSEENGGSEDLSNKENIVRVEHIKLEKSESFRILEPEKLRWSSQESRNKKTSQELSIMDYGVPSDPQIAENRRQVKLRHQELEEKLMKTLRTPRRENFSKSYSSTSSSSSETSSPRSVENGLSEESEDEQPRSRVEEFKNGYWNRNYGLLPLVKSDLQVDIVTERRDRLDLELSSPSEILQRKFGSLPRTSYHHDPWLVEVEFSQPQMVTKGYIDPTRRGHTLLSMHQEICEDAYAATMVEECQTSHTNVSNISLGNDSEDVLIGRLHQNKHRVSRFGEEAARLANQRFSKVGDNGI